MTKRKIKIPVENLIVGLYIDLELGWADHPFTFSKFKIKNEKEIRVIKSLNLSDITVFQGNSDVPIPTDKPQNESTDPDPIDTEQDKIDINAQWDEKKDCIDQASALREKRKLLTKLYQEKARRIAGLTKDMSTKPANAIQNMDEIVGEMVSDILNSDDLLTNMVSMDSDDYSEAHHTANVAMLSLMLGAAEELSENDMKTLASGALLHDIGMLKVPHNIRYKKEALSKAELNIYKQHPLLGRKLIEMVKKMDSRLMSIIEHHHEYLDGSGYPYGIKSGQISKLVRIITIVDLYDELCNPVDNDKALTPKVALATLYSKYEHKIDRSLVQKLIGILGIYPPGTIVKLSDGSIALVISTEPNHVKSPDVIIYDPTTPKEDSTIIRLKFHEDITVEQALNPGSYPPEINNYFKLSDRIGYMIQSQEL